MAYKVSVESKFKFVFEMKDLTKYPFSVEAKTEKEARTILQHHMEQIMDQLEAADKAEAALPAAVPSEKKG